MNTIKFLIVALASIAISLTGGLVLMQYTQYTHGQNSSSSMVDKLIEDTKRDNEEQKRDKAIKESYRDALINKIENTSCWKEIYFNEQGWEDVKNNDKILEQIRELEFMIKYCTGKGIIK